MVHIYKKIIKDKFQNVKVQVKIYKNKIPKYLGGVL